MTLGDRIVIMKDGVIMQVGTPSEVFDTPSNLFVAEFIGAPKMNTFKTRLTCEDGKYYVNPFGSKLEVTGEKGLKLAENHVSNKEVILGVRPEHILVDSSAALKGTVDVYEMMGSEMHYHVSYMDKDIIIIVPTIGNKTIDMGEEIAFAFNGNAVHVFDKETGVNLEM